VNFGLCTAVRSCAVLLGLLLGTSGTVLAQADDPLLEGRLLRSSASQESQGNLAEAERILRDLMAQRPTSSGGLFALERVLRSRGRIGDVLPMAIAYRDAEPAAAAPRVLMLRVYSELGAQGDLVDAAELWIEESGMSAEPYREVSRVFERVFGPQRAFAVLNDGREVLEQPSLFAMEMGDILRELGRVEEAVLEWARVIDDDGAQVSAVMRRVTEIEEDRADMVRPLVAQLASAPTTVARQRVAARIAVEAGLIEEALELAGDVAQALEGQARRGFLTALARQAEEVGGAADLTLWAYMALQETATDAAEVRALDHRIADAALVAGDTAMALAAQGSIAEGLPVGSGERRRALAEVLRLEISRGVPDARASLDRFRVEYPYATETDELAVTLAVRLEEEGDGMGARSLLSGVDGPKSLLERGFLYLASAEVVPARMNLREAIPGLPPTSATDLISLLSLLDELQGESLAVVMSTSVLAHRGRTAAAVQEVQTMIDQLPRADRPLLLAHGARLADEGELITDAAALRALIVAGYPDAAETPEATLELARFRGATVEGVEEAVQLLEDLILSMPENAVVPMARRELQKLKAGRGS
jgi:hypothetical protein